MQVSAVFDALFLPIDPSLDLANPILHVGFVHVNRQPTASTKSTPCSAEYLLPIEATAPQESASEYSTEHTLSRCSEIPVPMGQPRTQVARQLDGIGLWAQSRLRVEAERRRARAAGGPAARLTGRAVGANPLPASGAVAAPRAQAIGCLVDSAFSILSPPTDHHCEFPLHHHH